MQVVQVQPLAIEGQPGPLGNESLFATILGELTRDGRSPDYFGIITGNTDDSDLGGIFALSLD